MREVRHRVGGVPEWLKGTDCKSVGARLRWFKSNPLHQQPSSLTIIRRALPPEVPVERGALP